MIEAVIFDLDGVLIDSEPYFIESEVEIFNKRGVPLTKEDAYQYLGLKMDDFMAAIERNYKVPFDHAEIAVELHDSVAYVYEHKVPLFPHAAQMLKTLQDSYKLGLATSREKLLANGIMKRHGILSYFEKGVYREDVKNGKPNPEVFLSAAKALGVKPANCAVVEDARNGFMAARSAGMYVIGYKAGHNGDQDFSEAAVVVEDLSRIPIVLRGV